MGNFDPQQLWKPSDCADEIFVDASLTDALSISDPAQTWLADLEKYKPLSYIFSKP